MSLIIDPGTLSENKITSKMLRGLPIPPPSVVVVKSLNKKQTDPGSPKKISKKLHCIHCGRLRDVKLSTVALNLDGKVSMIYLRVKKLKRSLRERKKMNIPPYFVGTCGICLANTYYKLNRNNKFEVEQNYNEEVTNASSGFMGGEVPANQD